jgi:hypothetical protein
MVSTHSFSASGLALNRGGGGLDASHAFLAPPNGELRRIGRGRPKAVTS